MDINIKNISVSRTHAKIEVVDGSFLKLRDNNSKFGSLIRFKQFPISFQNRSLCIQVGRTLLQFNLTNKKNTLKECMQFYNYNQQGQRYFL